MSGGRVELGLGAGWYAREHEAYGIPFPEKRFGILEEQLAVITGLWETPVGETFSFSGEHYTLTDSPALPKPAQERVPVIVGGHGPRRTPALAARYASEFNAAFPDLGVLPDRFENVRAACLDADRDPDSLVYSAAFVVAVGKDEAEFRRRADAISGASPTRSAATVWPARSARSRTRSRPPRSRARRASTSRRSTCTTSTTWSSSRARSCRSCRDARAHGSPRKHRRDVGTLPCTGGFFTRASRTGET